MEKSLKHQCINVISTSQSENLSRYALLEWINSNSPVQVKKIESLCSGFVYCYILDSLFPGCLSLTKVKRDATQEVEYLQNLKYLQAALRKVGSHKDVPITLLAKGRFQDNLEFLQWFKKFYDVNYPVYDCDSKLERSNEQNLSYTIAEETYIESELQEKTEEFQSLSGKPTARILPLRSGDSTGKKRSNSPLVPSSSVGAQSSQNGRDFVQCESARSNLEVRKLEAKLSCLHEKREAFSREVDFYSHKLMKLKDLISKNPEQEAPDATNLREEILRVICEENTS